MINAYFSQNLIFKPYIYQFKEYLGFLLSPTLRLKASIFSHLQNSKQDLSVIVKNYTLKFSKYTYIYAVIRESYNKLQNDPCSVKSCFTY